MKYAVLADIHSNLEALTAVVAAAQQRGAEQYLCLGDMVGYGADPAACLQQLRDLNATMIAGNHDWACVGKVPITHFNRYARAAVEWTREQLSFGDLNFLRSLRALHRDALCTLVHGTLRAPEKFDYLFEVAQALETAMLARTPLCFVGHTHLPFVIEVDLRTTTVSRVLRMAEAVARVPLAVTQAKYVINPGSVGQPRDHDPRASFALLDTEESWIEIRRVEYDVAAAQRKIRQAGLPAILADRLAMGQ